MNLKGVAVEQIAPRGDDAVDQRAFAVGFDQRADQVALVYGNQLEGSRTD
jgi:hypothetical protein